MRKLGQRHIALYCTCKHNALSITYISIQVLQVLNSNLGYLSYCVIYSIKLLEDRCIHFIVKYMYRVDI